MIDIRRLTDNMYLLAHLTGPAAKQIYTFKKDDMDVALWFTSPMAADRFIKAAAVPRDKIGMAPVTGWEMILEKAKILQNTGCTLFVIDPRDDLLKCGGIQQFIDAVQEIVDGHRDYGMSQN